MKLRLIIIILVAMSLTACSSSDSPNNDILNFSATTTDSNKREINKYLAYEHRVTIDVAEKTLKVLFNNVIKHCASDNIHACTVLDSRLNTGRNISANIGIRVKSEGVKQVITIATKGGEIINQSTHVEDLAKPIVDSDNRLKMLRSYRTKLIELENKAVNDIDALIKISSELSKVQGELEQTMGSNKHLLLRTNTDIVNIRFVVNKSRGFWTPVSRSLSSFSGNLSAGISQAITATAYILPWLVIIVGIGFFFRYMWRRGKKA